MRSSRCAVRGHRRTKSTWPAVAGPSSLESRMTVAGGWRSTGLSPEGAAELEARVPFPEVSEPAAEQVATRDRFRGALLGGAVGDALGRPFEGSRRPADDPPRFLALRLLPWVTEP